MVAPSFEIVTSYVPARVLYHRSSLREHETYPDIIDKHFIEP
jgi:hypothetical protein